MSDTDTTPMGPGFIRFNLTTLSRSVVEAAVNHAHPLVLWPNAADPEEGRNAANTALDTLPTPSEASWKVLILSTIDTAPELAAGRNIFHLALATDEATFWEHVRAAWRTMLEDVYKVSRW